MRVLLVSSKYMPEYAGSGLRAHQTYLRLREKYGLSFRVLTGSVTAQESSNYEWDGVSVTRIAFGESRIPSPPGLPRTRIRSAIAYWRTFISTYRFLWKYRNEFDLIHVYGASLVTSAAVTFAKIHKRPIMVEVVNLRSTPNQTESRLISRLIGTGYPPGTIIVCISNRLGEMVARNGYSKSQIWTRPNAVDEGKFAFNRGSAQALRDELSFIGESDKLVLQLAKFMPNKNQMLSVKAISLLPESYKLLLAGPLVSEGPESAVDQAYFREVSEAIETLGLSDRVKLLPDFVESPERLYGAADVVLVPSFQEAGGNPVTEALVCGVPVVATNIQGVLDHWIRDGENGFLCDLVPDIWATRIQEAAEIPVEEMRSASDQVLGQASTSVIDQAYYERLAALSGEA